MNGDPNCAHERMVDDDPESVGGGWVGRGYVCADCGFQTARAETYVPVVKPCLSCSKDFEGMSDVPDEICDDCVGKNLSKFLRARSGGVDE